MKLKAAEEIGIWIQLSFSYAYLINSTTLSSFIYNYEFHMLLNVLLIKDVIGAHPCSPIFHFSGISASCLKLGRDTTQSELLTKIMCVFVFFIWFHVLYFSLPYYSDREECMVWFFSLNPQEKIIRWTLSFRNLNEDPSVHGIIVQMPLDSMEEVSKPLNYRVSRQNILIWLHSRQ